MVHTAYLGSGDDVMAALKRYYYLLGEDELPIYIKHTARPAKDNGYQVIWNYYAFRDGDWFYAGQLTWPQLRVAIYLGRVE